MNIEQTLQEAGMTESPWLMSWMTPSPSQSPRQPPSSEQSFSRLNFGNLDSITLTLGSNVRKKNDLPSDKCFSLVVTPLIYQWNLKNKLWYIHFTLVSRHGRGQGDKTLPYAKFKRPWEISRKLGSVVETFLRHNDNSILFPLISLHFFCDFTDVICSPKWHQPIKVLVYLFINIFFIAVAVVVKAFVRIIYTFFILVHLGKWVKISDLTMDSYK